MGVRSDMEVIRKKYKGIYEDEFGKTEIKIENDFENLFLEIDGVKFIGSEFSDFAIDETQNYSKIQLERFSFYAIPIHGTDKFKNCYGCMYGDYSVYGQSGFGSMLCYVNQKDEYIKVRTKEDYLSKLNTNYKKLQEIFYCPKFELREKGIGYRG